MAEIASAFFRCASRTHRTTLARLTEYRLATCVKDIPATRSATSLAWSTWIGDLPRLNPSSFRRRIPARILSAIKLRSNSAIAPVAQCPQPRRFPEWSRLAAFGVSLR